MANAFSVFIDASDLERIGNNIARAQTKIPGSITKQLRTLGGKALTAAQREAPVGKTITDQYASRKGGALRRSLAKTEDFGFGDPSVSITEDVPHGVFVRKGTRAHIILPRFKKALYWPGAAHPVRMVHHPGTTANPYHERAADSIRSDVEKAGFTIVTDAAKEVVKP